MSGFWADKYRVTAFCIIAVVSPATGSDYTCAVWEYLSHCQIQPDAAHHAPEVASIVDSACNEIYTGDFEGARRILDKTVVSDSNDIMQLRKITDEYRAIKERREALQDEIYKTQINALQELRQMPLSNDANNIGKVFSLILSMSEYADKEQKQSLLKDPLLIQAVRKAKAKAAQFEAEGKSLDAYTICYNKLERIYEDNKTYSVYADRLLDKADIWTSFQDSRYEPYEEHYAGITKQTFINAVDVLDSRYVNIIDYRRMAVKGIDRCKLLVEVMSKLGADNEFRMTNSQYAAWLGALERIVNEINRSQTKTGKDEFVDVFNKVLAINKSPRARTALPAAALIAQFAKGSLSALDPYTAIYWPNQAQAFKKAMTRRFSGIGIKFSKQEGPAKVVTVFPDTPAYKSGLQAGDIIMAVDGVETKDIASDCLAKRITGPEDTKVTLKIKRFNEETVCDISLNRAKIVVPSVHGWRRTETGEWLYMIDDSRKIGYIRISSFCAKTSDDFESALYRIEEDGLKGLILDLRSNPGGLLSAAVEIADKFIAKGLILRTQPRFGISTYMAAHKEGTRAVCPVVVLINPLTASASEVLAGVLQDPKYKRAVVVGQRSYGKGSVQSMSTDCGKGSQLKYTVAYYHLPSGRRVESRHLMETLGRTDWGIIPDVNVDLHSDQLQEIANVQKINGFLVTNGNEDPFGGVSRYSSRQTVDADPQLAVVLLVLKSKMIQSGAQPTTQRPCTLN